MILKGNWSYPTTIWFGAGRLAEIGAACHQAAIQRPLLVTDSMLATLPIVDNALSLMEAAGLGRAICAKVKSNPTERDLQACLEAYKNGNHDGVIAFGGGSGLDVGKMVAFMHGQTRPIWDFEDVGDLWKRANADAIAPVIAVPTTAGTGSEVGSGGVITNSQTHEKKIIFHPKVMPRVVISDPELTLGMPPAITAGTGMDAFAHCLEAYCVNSFHPMASGIAAEGLRIVKEFLPRAYLDGSDLEARSQMLAAAAMGAVSFQKGLGAVHALSHPVGAIYNTHHGTTNAVVLPPVLLFNRPAIEEKINLLAAYLNINGGFNGFLNFIRQLNQSLNIPSGLKALGVKENHLDSLTRSALSDPTATTNPVPMTLQNTRELFLSAM